MTVTDTLKELEAKAAENSVAFNNPRYKADLIAALATLNKEQS